MDSRSDCQVCLLLHHGSWDGGIHSISYRYNENHSQMVTPACFRVDPLRLVADDDNLLHHRNLDNVFPGYNLDYSRLLYNFFSLIHRIQVWGEGAWVK